MENTANTNSNGNNGISSFIIGEKAILRPLVKEDAYGNYPNWFNDADVCEGNSHHIYPYSIDMALEFIQSLFSPKNIIVFAIIDKDSGVHVGNVSLQNINYINRKAEFAIIIGEKSTWGKGLGKEAAYLMARHGFSTLNLNRIECGIFENNIGAQKMMTFIGMRLEGTRRSAVYKNGAYLDILEYGVLKEEFNEISKNLYRW